MPQKIHSVGRISHSIPEEPIFLWGDRWLMSKFSTAQHEGEFVPTSPDRDPPWLSASLATQEASQFGQAAEELPNRLDDSWDHLARERPTSRSATDTAASDTDSSTAAAAAATDRTIRPGGRFPRAVSGAHPASAGTCRHQATLPGIRP